MDNFFPPEYEGPKAGASKYMSLGEAGTYRIRVLSPVVIGIEYWDKSSEKAKVHRVKTMAQVPEEYVKTTDRKKKAKEFWGFLVWNYEEETLQILTITQVTIMRGIISIMEDADFGKINAKTGKNDVSAYDIKIKREDEGRVTYSVAGAPPKALDKAIAEAVKESDMTQDSCYTDEDEVKPEKEKKSEEVKADEVPF